ncbi:DUF4124 domain-containing protein [Alkalisalibacterium limincola]|uniref:DUF4124 domain-containing protein n=1 Tax=Alkalisalibacterium limincola TaxID=2699169 RepID=A0A5C8KNK9_9GAMM|nr:DUF4124 domain-containing protein [Alkalisalibacterium limincola]
MRPAIALIVCLSLPATSLAANSINRCLDASGNTVFTDRPCSQHGARDMPRTGAVAGDDAPAGGTVVGRPGPGHRRPPEPADRLRGRPGGPGDAPAGRT